MESFGECMNVSVIHLKKLTVIEIGRFECVSILAVVPNSVQKLFFSRFLLKQKSFRKFELSYKSTTNSELCELS